MGYLFSPITSRIKNFFTRSVEGGALSVVHVASSPHLSRTGAKLFSDTAGGFTVQAGCKGEPDECGARKKLPALVQEHDSQQMFSLWDASRRVIPKPPKRKTIASSQAADEENSASAQADDDLGPKAASDTAETPNKEE